MKPKLKNLFEWLEEDIKFGHDSEDNKEATLGTVQQIKQQVEELENNQMDYTQAAIDFIFLLMLGFIFYVVMWIFY
jgi:hypothetical protein